MLTQISFIVPIYNGITWIDRCISSLLHQSITELEVIIVDDGSVDDSYIYSLNYQKNDPRVHVYNIKHSGLSAARNYGVSKAIGKYIGFLDVDDWIDLQFSEILLEAAQMYNAEIASCVSVAAVDIIPSVMTASPAKQYVFSPLEYLLLEYKDAGVNVRMGNKIYSKELFQNTKFPINMLYEDIITNYELCSQCSHIIHTILPLHHYYIGNISITRSPLINKDFDLPDQWRQVRARADLDFPDLSRQVHVMEVTALRSLADKYVKYGGDRKAKRALKRRFGEEGSFILFAKEIAHHKKLRSLTAILSIRLYGKVTALIRKDSQSL